MMNEPQFDSIYINFVTPPFVDCENVAREIAAAAKAGSKPIVCNYMTDKRKWGATTQILKEGNVPCFDFAETAARALHSLYRYHQIKSAGKGSVIHFPDVDPKNVESILTSVKKEDRDVLTAAESYGILESYRIPVAAWKVVNTIEEVAACAQQIGFPVVIKADSDRIIHKSDVGGVAVNIKDSNEATAVAERMRKELGKDIRFFIQKFLSKEMELIVGAQALEGIGHKIGFGLGGIFIDLLKDVAFVITPVTDTEAGSLLQSLKATPLINGFRGMKGINREKTAEIILRVSQLTTDFPEIRELDLNPLFATGNDICAVDARIIL